MNELTLKDIFAAIALHGLLIKYGERLPQNEDTDGGEYADLASASYALADCMIRERER